MCLLPAAGHPLAFVVSSPTHAWGAILPDESSISRRPDDLVRGNGHSVELRKARSQSWKPQDPAGLLRAH